MNDLVLEELWEIYGAITGALYQIRLHMEKGHDEVAEGQMITALSKLDRLVRECEELDNTLIYHIDRVINSDMRGNRDIAYILSELESILGVQ